MLCFNVVAQCFLKEWKIWKWIISLNVLKSCNRFSSCCASFNIKVQFGRLHEDKHMPAVFYYCIKSGIVMLNRLLNNEFTFGPTFINLRSLIKNIQFFPCIHWIPLKRIIYCVACEALRHIGIILSVCPSVCLSRLLHSQAFYSTLMKK